MEKIIIIAHGSLRNNANQLEGIVIELAKILDFKPEDITLSFLRYGKPSPFEAVSTAISKGATRIIIHPLFLIKGVHVEDDISKLVREFERIFPNIKFLCTKPLGQSSKLAIAIKELIDEARVSQS